MISIEKRRVSLPANSWAYATHTWLYNKAEWSDQYDAQDKDIHPSSKGKPGAGNWSDAALEKEADGKMKSIWCQDQWLTQQENGDESQAKMQLLEKENRKLREHLFQLKHQLSKKQTTVKVGPAKRSGTVLEQSPPMPKLLSAKASDNNDENQPPAPEPLSFERAKTKMDWCNIAQLEEVPLSSKPSPMFVVRDGNDNPATRDDFLHGVTTLLVRNIPFRMTQRRLAEIWPPENTWNILHMPWSMAQQRRASYVFINFVSYSAVAKFIQAWQGKVLRAGPRSRPLDIRPADVQGFWANLHHIHLKLSSSGDINDKRSSDFKPIIFGSDGELLDVHEFMAFTTFRELSL
jgi:hypothetical protein